MQAQVRRMLRLLPGDAHHISRFQGMHPPAREAGFGRLFRSPTLFEDMLKSILLCNCGYASGGPSPPASSYDVLLVSERSVLCTVLC